MQLHALFTVSRIEKLKGETCFASKINLAQSTATKRPRLIAEKNLIFYSFIFTAFVNYKNYKYSTISSLVILPSFVD